MRRWPFVVVNALCAVVLLGIGAMLLVEQSGAPRWVVVALALVGGIELVTAATYGRSVNAGRSRG